MIALIVCSRHDLSIAIMAFALNPSAFSANANSYAHRSLLLGEREIRVLQLEKGCSAYADHGGPLRLRVKTVKVPHAHHSFASARRLFLGYYAISYAWGENTASAQVVLDGKPATVPYSAEEALRGVLAAMSKAALSAASAKIWIDAICINQLDQREKEQQVALMGDVYRCAKGVLVWWGSQRDEEMSLSALQNHSDPDWMKYYRRLDRLLERRWFTRLWVVQEVVLAREVYCFQADDFLPWRKFARAVHHVKRERATHNESQQSPQYTAMLIACVLCDLRRSRVRPPSQIFGLNLTRNASSPHDRVFAMLGMLPIREFAIRPDYSRPLVDLYGEAIFATMEAECSLEMLWHAAIFQDYQQNASNDSPPLDEWPTWLARLDALDGVRNTRCAAMLGESFRASRGASPVLEKVPDSRRIRVAGVIVCEVQGVHPLVPGRNTSRKQALQDEAVRTNALRDRALIDKTPFAYSELNQPAPVEVLGCVADLAEPDTLQALDFQWSRAVFEEIATMLPKTYDPSHRDIQEDSYALATLMFRAGQQVSLPNDTVLKQVLNDCRDASQSVSVISMMGLLWNFAAGLLNFLGHSSLVRLRDGRFGIATNSVRPGDQICIVFGQAAPLVLRPCSDAWQLRGVARVNGIMQGELIQQLTTNGSLLRETRMFELQ